AFSPNGDGINDTWQIQYLHARNPQCVVQVFNRAGQMVFQSNGYAKPWDGRYQGNLLPFGTYYYIIKQNSFSQPISG
ncbi:gliding motility-associated C-terminal domain-containing protein, partial [Acinetobacter baumannii]